MPPIPANPSCCAVAGVTCSTRKLPLPSYCNVAYSYWVPASANDVLPDALASGYRMLPPLVPLTSRRPLTCTVGALPWWVETPIAQPTSTALGTGKVTAGDAPGAL